LEIEGGLCVFRGLDVDVLLGVAVTAVCHRAVVVVIDQGQTVEPVQVSLGQLPLGPGDGLPGHGIEETRVQIARYGRVVVSQNGRDFPFPEQVENLPGPGAVANHVSNAQKPVGTSLFSRTHHSLQGDKVGVDIS
jgi:hypothetical protein